MAAKDIDLATDYVSRSVLLVDDDIASFEIATQPAFTMLGQAPEIFLVDVGAGGGGISAILNPQGGMGAMKGQYIASEELRIILPPFMDTATNQFITAADVVTLTIKKPDNTLLAPAPTAVRDGDTDFWVAVVPVVDFQSGEWLIKAESDAANTLSQFVSLVWGDYLDDMHQASLGRWKVANNQLTLYKEDGVTALRTFNLKDGDGLPSSSQVFERDPV